MEQKKYELTKETMYFDGVTLHRIKALKDFRNVDAGELGGWVESEKNLSQSGDCWIAYGTHYEEGDDYNDVPASMLDEHHMKFAKPNMPTHWMKMPTHP